MLQLLLLQPILALLPELPELPKLLSVGVLCGVLLALPLLLPVRCGLKRDAW